jgi:hypothetical protein
VSAPVTELRGLALLDLAIAQIEAHPETWNQQVYRCKTGMCVAGWAAQLAGGQWLNGPESYGKDADNDALIAEPYDRPGDIYLLGGASVVDADSRARLLIGLSSDEADALFEADLTLDDIRRGRDLIAARVAS